jgi:hypothetical protein
MEGWISIGHRGRLLRQKAGSRFTPLFLLASALFCAPAPLAAQGKHAAALRVPSTLVLVPAFVYDMRPVQAPNETKWYRCADQNRDLLVELPPSHPFLPKNCRQGVIHGLTARNFHLFQNGVQQKLQGVVVQQWSLLVRDNLTWHYEFSFTPAGKWSTPDLGPLGFYPNGRDPLYLLTYVPPRSKLGTCQKIRVQVTRPHSKVLARPEYCAGQTPSDPLFGTKLGNEIQQELASSKPGGLPVSLQAVPLYAANGKSRVYISMRVPWKSLQHGWNLSNWHLRATIAVLGTISGKNGAIAARFSDLAYPSYWPAFVSGQLAAFNAELDFLDSWQMPPLDKVDPAWIPNRYETELPLAPGRYDLHVVFTDGKKFGRAEVPLVVKSPPQRHLALSSIVLCKRLRSASAAAAEASAGDFAPRYVPLVSKDIQFSPAASTSFAATGPLFAFFQIHLPSSFRSSAQSIKVNLRIVSAGTGTMREDFAPVSVASYVEPGDPLISIARKIPISRLPAGAYTLEVKAMAGEETTQWRMAKFTVP